MPEEYSVSLEWARTALDMLPDAVIRDRLNKTIAGLTDDISIAPHRRQKQNDSA